MKKIIIVLAALLALALPCLALAEDMAVYHTEHFSLTLPSEFVSEQKSTGSYSFTYENPVDSTLDFIVFTECDLPITLDVNTVHNVVLPLVTGNVDNFTAEETRPFTINGDDAYFTTGYFSVSYNKCRACLVFYPFGDTLAFISYTSTGRSDEDIEQKAEFYAKCISPFDPNSVTPAPSLDALDPSTHDISLLGMSYDELVALKNRINLAMWESEEWQEVTVPQGLWIVGEDIPAGHWTVMHSNASLSYVTISDILDETGKKAEYGGDFYYSNGLHSPDSKYFDASSDLTEFDIELTDGLYVHVEYGDVIFAPYRGKPSLGFK